MLTVDRRMLKLVGLVFLVSLVALMLACTPSDPQSTFDTSGPVARSQLRLFYWIFWAGLFVFIAVEGAIIYAVIRFRRRPGQGDPEQIHGNSRLEIAWTIAPALVLLVIVGPSIAAIFDNATAPRTPEEGGLAVDVIGHQWWFEFRYAHPDNDKEQVTFANELHIPVGEPLTLRLDSVDVIHSFWVPKLGGKVDMVPNNDNSLWLQADEPGEFFGQCAEFCGVSHANMRIRVIAQPREEFDAWLRTQAAPPAEPADPLAQEGKKLFRSAGCNGCHATDSIMKLRDDGTMVRGRKGPNLAHVASRRIIVGGVLENTDEFGNFNDSILQANLRKWLRDPKKLKPDNLMSRDAAIYNIPERALAEREISALVSYLLTLK